MSNDWFFHEQNVFIDQVKGVSSSSDSIIKNVHKSPLIKTIIFNYDFTRAEIFKNNIFKSVFKVSVTP